MGWVVSSLRSHPSIAQCGWLLGCILPQRLPYHLRIAGLSAYAERAMRQCIGQSSRNWLEGIIDWLSWNTSPCTTQQQPSLGFDSHSLHLGLPYLSRSTRINTPSHPGLLAQFPAILPVGTPLQQDPCLTSASFLVRPAPRTHFSRRSPCLASCCFGSMQFYTNLNSRAVPASHPHGRLGRPLSLDKPAGHR